MLNRVYWAVAHRVLVVKYAGIITSDDIEQATLALKAELATISEAQSIHIVFDCEDADHFQIEVSLRNARFTAGRVLTHPGVAWIVFIFKYAAYPRVYYITDIVSRLLKLRLKNVSTRAEALSTLRQLDPTLFATHQVELSTGDTV